ncbi:DinB family protein [Propioniciclava flava]|uniref:DinB family protein n=1 Tax=Propioniciclava flava TaxID=2072026 RepID=A0A4Q2EGR4_9ACTN|nr:DinB family protein [Propioniciclava flava]RXW32740.1 hypothetical protein C1706_06250 [Propioniciclava flava]
MSRPFASIVDAPLRTQLDTILDEHRAALDACLDGLTEEEARRRLVPSRTTLLGLVKHATYVERVWFGEVIGGIPRTEQGLPAAVADSFLLTEEDTIASLQAAHREACAASRDAVTGMTLDDVALGGHHGPLPLRWIYPHLVRELAQHCGHADILREQILAAR